MRGRISAALAAILLGTAGCASSRADSIRISTGGVVYQLPRGTIRDSTPAHVLYETERGALFEVRDGRMSLNGVDHGKVEFGDRIELFDDGRLLRNGAEAGPGR